MTSSSGTLPHDVPPWGACLTAPESTVLVGVLDQEAADRLSEELITWWCTLRPDGSPHQTPVWSCYLDGAFWVSTAQRNAKVANTRRDPRVLLRIPVHRWLMSGEARQHVPRRSPTRTTDAAPGCEGDALPKRALPPRTAL